MDLNEDFINIQGILLSIEKSAGSLKRIKHRGGNEIIILNIITELHKLLSSKNYIKNKKINDVFNERLKDICTFLILNTELKRQLNEPGFQHLINIMPQLSTCLLANIIVGLDLSKQYCEALLRFDLDITEELLIEMIPCIKKCKPKIHILNAHEFLKLIVTKVSASTEKVADDVDKLTDIASQMLLNLTGLHGEQIENVKMDSVHECMGLTLLNLLNLLLTCNEKNTLLNSIIEKMIKTCCSIVMAVTLNVFCSWAEVEYEDEVLQIFIARRSYMFIEKYQKFPLAKELISMLGTIAQKPRSIKQLILTADVPKMISMINKADANQKDWFTALLNTQVLQCKDSIKCIDRWAHLSTCEDVSRLLNLSVNSKDTSARKVVVKCAATLEFKDLVLVTTRYFYHNGITNNLNENVQPQLILLFNKIKDKNVGDDFCKELYLLLLQNPEQTLAYSFAECLKNTFYSSNLATFWRSVKEFITIDDMGIKALKNEINNNLPDEHNCKNYIHLFNALIQANTFSIETITLGIVLPLLQDSFNKENYQLVRHGLEILNDLQGNMFFNEKIESFFDFLFHIMKTCRCNFVNFSGVKKELVKLCVDILEKYSNSNCNVSSDEEVKSEDLFILFYKRKLFRQNSTTDVLTHFFPVNAENHAVFVTYLIKILPLCVTPEWMMITSNLINSRGVEKTAELLCDCIILLCEVVKSQETESEERRNMLQALQYGLQNLGIVIKECVQPKINTLQKDVSLTKNVCRLLKEIPPGNLKSEEGLSLASLLSDASLRSLRPDKRFAVLVASINESHICKMLAQKILS